MSTPPLPAHRVRWRPNPPTAAQSTARLLLAAVPADEWVTTEQMHARAALTGLRLDSGPGGVMLGRRRFVEVLRDLRRSGHVTYHRHGTPPTWRRTPKGTASAGTLAPVDTTTP